MPRSDASGVACLVIGRPRASEGLSLALPTLSSGARRRARDEARRSLLPARSRSSNTSASL
eukprot:3193011-Heterocapsa_arctica.AAC.1